MERELERTKEKEPVIYDTSVQDHIRSLRTEKDILADKPHVIKFESHPWTQGMSCYHKHLLRHGWREPWDTWPAPIYTLRAWKEILAPGQRNGRHRHFGEAMFYIVEGKGWEVHDEVHWDWEAGDVMCVPTYCVHQHFADPVAGATQWVVNTPITEFMGLGYIEQMEVHPKYQLTEQDKGILGTDEALQEAMRARARAASFTGKPQTTYDGYLALLGEEVRWRQACPHVVKGRERPWENTRMGMIKYLVHPQVPSGLLTVESWLMELPPQGHSGKHRHVAEEVHIVLQGQGYDIHDGVRWDWDTDDIIGVPVNSIHQHFNSDPYRTALLYTVQSRLYAFIGHGGIEHIEDASNYRHAK